MANNFKFNPAIINTIAKSSEMTDATLDIAKNIANSLGAEYSSESAVGSSRNYAKIVASPPTSYRERAQGGPLTQFVAKNGRPS